ARGTRCWSRPRRAASCTTRCARWSARWRSSASGSGAKSRSPRRSRRATAPPSGSTRRPRGSISSKPGTRNRSSPSLPRGGFRTARVLPRKNGTVLLFGGPSARTSGRRGSRRGCRLGDRLFGVARLHLHAVAVDTDVDRHALDLPRDHRPVGADPQVGVLAERNVAQFGDVLRLDRAARVWRGPRAGGRGTLAERLLHEILPDPRGQPTACDPGKRGVVVVADPYADDESAGVSHEQRVAIVLRGAGLAVVRRAEHRRPAGAAVDR